MRGQEAALWVGGIAALMVGAVALVMEQPWLSFMLVLAVFACVTFLEQGRSFLGSAPWAVPLVLTIGALCIDARGLTGEPGPARYALPLLVIVIAYALRTRAGHQYWKLLWTVAAALVLYGLAGTLIGLSYGDLASTALPALLPLLVVLVGTLRSSATPDDYRTGLTWIAVAGTAFAVAAGLVRLGVLPEVQVRVAGHERAFVVVTAIACAWAARRWWLVASASASLVFAFSTYPAATYVISAGMIVATVGFTRARWSSATRTSLAGATLLAAGWGVLHVDELINWFAGYFEAVGKTDNGSTRAEFYGIALDELDGSFFSSGFTRDVSISGLLSGQKVASLDVHNDYLAIALGGGLAAAALFLGIFLAANGLVLRRLATAGPMQRRTMIALLGGLNAAAVSAFANPVFLNPGGATAAWALLAALIGVSLASLGAPADEGQDSSDAAAPHVRARRTSA